MDPVALSKPVVQRENSVARQLLDMAFGQDKISFKQTEHTTGIIMNAKNILGMRQFDSTQNGMLLVDWPLRLVLLDSYLVSTSAMS